MNAECVIGTNPPVYARNSSESEKQPVETGAEWYETSWSVAESSLGKMKHATLPDPTSAFSCS